MSVALSIWLTGLLVFIGFSAWYNNWRGRLSVVEIADYTERVKRRDEAGDGLVLNDNSILTKFMEQDNGKEFYMLNMLRLQKAPIEHPITREIIEPLPLLMQYFKPFITSIFARAGHPVLQGPVVGGYIEAWNVEENPGWGAVGIIRYRSRRDMLELALNPHFDSIHIFKALALHTTFAIPFEPNSGFVLSPRIWVGLVIALVSAISQILIV